MSFNFVTIISSSGLCVDATVTTKESLIFNYKVGDTFIEIPMQTEEIKEKVNYVNRLVGGRVVYKDPSHLLTKILKIYGAGVSDLDLVYFIQ